MNFAPKRPTVPPPDIGNRVAVGKLRAYRDREKSALGSNMVLPNNSNRGHAVGAVKIHGRQN